MSQGGRVLTMVRWLREDGGFTTKQCIDEFEICDRQVKRDIDHIRSGMGVGVTYSRSSGKYVPTGAMDDYDYLDGKLVTFIALTMKLAKSQGLTELISEELETLLRHTVSKDRLQSVISRIEMKSAISDLPADKVLPVVVDSMSRETRFEFVYRPGTDREEHFSVEPLRLINYSSRWYILAWIPEPKDGKAPGYRVFHLARMKNCNATKTKWTNTCPKNEINHLSRDGWGMFVSEKGEGETFDATIILESDVASNIENQIWHKNQKAEKLPDGRLKITVPVFDTRELLSKVLSFGASAIPVAPAEFVAEWAATVEKMSENT